MTLLTASVLANLFKGSSAWTFGWTPESKIWAGKPRNSTCPSNYSLLGIEFLFEDKERAVGGLVGRALHQQDAHGAKGVQWLPVTNPVEFLDCLQGGRSYELSLHQNNSELENTNVAIHNSSLGPFSLQITIDHSVVWEETLKEVVSLVFCLDAVKVNVTASAEASPPNWHELSFPCNFISRSLQVRSFENGVTDMQQQKSQMKKKPRMQQHKAKHQLSVGVLLSRFLLQLALRTHLGQKQLLSLLSRKLPLLQ